MILSPSTGISSLGKWTNFNWVSINLLWRMQGGEFHSNYLSLKWLLRPMDSRTNSCWMAQSWNPWLCPKHDSLVLKLLCLKTPYLQSLWTGYKISRLVTSEWMLSKHHVIIKLVSIWVYIIKTFTFFRWKIGEMHEAVQICLPRKAKI